MWGHLSIGRLEAIAGKVGAAPASAGSALRCPGGAAAARCGCETRKGRTEDGHEPSHVAGGEHAGGEGPAAGSSAMLSAQRTRSGPAERADGLLKFSQALLLNTALTGGRLPCISFFLSNCVVCKPSATSYWKANGGQEAPSHAFPKDGFALIAVSFKVRI